MELDKEKLLWLYEKMYLSRLIDDREILWKDQNLVFFQINSAGHEAIGAGAAAAFVWHNVPAYVSAYYRDKCLVLSFGYDPEDMLKDAMGMADSPASGGRQMPAHWSSRPLRLVSTSSATGSQVLPAVGIAEATWYLNRVPEAREGLEYDPHEISLVTFGDGAAAEGEIKEAIDIACAKSLPVIFLLEDNGFGISVPADVQTPGGNFARNMSAYSGLEVLEANGLDPISVYLAVRKAINRAHAGLGPSLIRATCVRTYSHSKADSSVKYKTVQEIEDEIRKDPIVSTVDAYPLPGELKSVKFRLKDSVKFGTFGDYMLSRRLVSEAELIELRGRTSARVIEISNRLRKSPNPPDPASVLDHMYSGSPNIKTLTGPALTSNETVNFRIALNRTLASEMRKNPKILVFGEDVADARSEDILPFVKGKGGVFGVTYGLMSEFGSARCFNTGIAEASIIGRAIGLALRGLKPVAEIQFMDYIWPAFHQLRTELATFRWRSNGVWPAPLVIRTVVGATLEGGTAIWHSQNAESLFAHMPGLFVAYPSTPADAAGLLRTAIRADDPVLFLEHKRIYNDPKFAEPYPGDDYMIPFGTGKIVRSGMDLTIVTYGLMVHEAKKAAANLEAEGVSVEIIDLRCIAPWDFELVAGSVKKTSRVLVLHEDNITCGFGAEVAARIAEELFYDLDAPVSRLAALDCWVPYHHLLEKAALPNADKITSACKRLLNH